MKKVFVCVVALVLMSVNYGNAACLNDGLDHQQVMKESAQNPIGEDWKVLRGKWEKKDSGEIIAARSKEENNAMNLLMVQKQEIKEDKFSISAKIKNLSPAKSSSLGLAFNVQDADNYYAFRFTAPEEGGFVQMIRVVEGKAQQIFAEQHEGKIKALEFYTVKVSSEAPHNFSWSVADAAGNVILKGTAKDRVSQFKGGHAGLYGLVAGEFLDFSRE